MRMRVRGFGAIAIGAALTIALVGCSSSGSTKGAESPTSTASEPVTLTIYSGNHKDLIDALGKAFTKETGVKVSIRDGEDADMVNQIITEGSKTKADLYLSEEPGPIGQLSNAGLLRTVPQADYAGIDPRVVPKSADWIPYAARVRVIYYNPTLIKESQLPASILDLSEPEWKGKFAYAPSGAFVGTVSYLIHEIGEAKTEQWLKGIEANGINEHKNGKVRDTVEAGQHPFGLSNHYYWWVLAQQKGGPDKLTSKIHYFSKPDAGGLIMASGAGVLKATKHPAEAEKFLAWLVSPQGGQAIVAGSNADVSAAQIPVAKGMKSQIAGLPSLDSLVAPDTDQSVFADTKQATELIEQAGIS